MQTMYGLIGYPVGHSLSPVMMNQAFSFLSIDAYYGLFPVEPKDLDTALAGMKVLGFRGANVTIPHKEAVFQRLTQLSREAMLAKAVNTLVLGDNGDWTGHNTDVEGWWKSFDEDAQPDSTSVVSLLGAGGAARAVLTGLSVHAPGARVAIVARRQDAARRLAQEFSPDLEIVSVPWEQRHEQIALSGFVIQSTPIGMWPKVEASPVTDESCLHPGQVVQDLVYRPLTTALLAQAKRRGARTVDGARMLVGQGARAFELWTNQEAPIAEMRETLLGHLNLER